MRTLAPIASLLLLPACHPSTRSDTAEYHIRAVIVEPPDAAPDRVPRDLLRSTDRLRRRLPDAPSANRWLGIVLFNHADEPVARAIIQQRDNAAPLIALEQTQPYQGWQHLDAPEFKDWRDDAKRAHAKLAGAGPAPRSIEDADTLRITLPDSTDDDEVWLVIPLHPDNPLIPSWSYTNDAGPINAGSLAAWTIEQHATR